MSGVDIALAASAAVMVAGAAAATIVRDVPRLILAFGCFLLGVAGVFLTLGSPLLAVSEVFVYVGGVLVLVLFALMFAHRSSDERPRVASKHDLGAGVIAAGVFVLLAVVVAPLNAGVDVADVSPAEIGTHLLGRGIGGFELAGALLLLALVAVLVIVKGGEDG